MKTKCFLSALIILAPTSCLGIFKDCFNGATLQQTVGIVALGSGFYHFSSPRPKPHHKGCLSHLAFQLGLISSGAYLSLSAESKSLVKTLALGTLGALSSPKSSPQ
jgi:hypothetical protein